MNLIFNTKISSFLNQYSKHYDCSVDSTLILLTWLCYVDHLTCNWHSVFWVQNISTTFFQKKKKKSPRHDNVSQCFCCLFSDRRICKLSLFTFETINYSREFVRYESSRGWYLIIYVRVHSFVYLKIILQ